MDLRCALMYEQAALTFLQVSSPTTLGDSDIKDNHFAETGDEGQLLDRDGELRTTALQK